MPSGKVHSITNVVVALSSSATMFLLQRGNEATLGVATGAMVGIMVGCDNDVDSGNIADYIIKRYTGNIVETVWVMLWTVYRKAFKHRSFLSHFPLVSTIIRIAYLAAFYFLIATPLKYLSSFVQVDWAYFLWWAFVGLVLADTSHWGLDKLDEMMGGRL